VDATERDRMASDLAHPFSQLAGLTCGMRKVTGASGDEWLHWIGCLDEAINEIGIVFEAVTDGSGDYERVQPLMMAVMRGEATAGPLGRWQALKDWLGEQIGHDASVMESFADYPDDGITSRAHGAMVAASRNTLAKMTELEG
jgi:hypothetical protein